MYTLPAKIRWEKHSNLQRCQQEELLSGDASLKLPPVEDYAKRKWVSPPSDHVTFSLTPAHRTPAILRLSRRPPVRLSVTQRLSYLFQRLLSSASILFFFRACFLLALLSFLRRDERTTPPIARRRFEEKTFIK